ncbi:MAG TPA: undecaprenyl-phosphate glucose phosphotransferase [Casimicrobiaceae bacterium]|nr:undecaprenyl-phosphate glucose phosphotransferase [Casimicrobiaceae bacterium]
MARLVRKPQTTLFAVVLRVSDLVATVVVGLAVFRFYLDVLPPPERYVLLLGGAMLAISAIFPAFQLYEPQRGVSVSEELRELLLAWLWVGALVIGTLFATKSAETFSRVWIGSWLTGSLLLTAALRILFRSALRAMHRHGLIERRIVIVGAGELGRLVAERIRGSAGSGLTVLGFYDDDPKKQNSLLAGCPVLGSPDRLVIDVVESAIDQVWIALPLRAELRIRSVLALLREHPIEVRFVPDIYGFHLLNHSLTDVAGLPVISLTETPMSGINRLVKALEDYGLAAAGLILFSPLLLLIAVGVKLSSPGPVFYRQDRVTWNGERFTMYKFRTMPTDAEATSGPVWSRPGESRATPFGALLRRLSLDELPQLLNVLRGEMSLVGPRPERPEFVSQFRQQIPGYMQKHIVKAGITGWAQVHDLRGSSDLSKRIQYDLYYIDNWSLWFDLRILVLTLGHLLHSRNAY